MTPPQVTPIRFIIDGPEYLPAAQFRVEWDDNLQEVRFHFVRNEKINLEHYAERGMIQILKDIPPDREMSTNSLTVPIRDRQQLHEFCSRLTTFALALALNAAITIDHNQ